jgi:tetratricopeptide (TPR) repeat protein
VRRIVIYGCSLLFFFLFLTLIDHGGNPEERSIIETPLTFDTTAISETELLENNLVNNVDQIESPSRLTIAGIPDTNLEENPDLETSGSDFTNYVDPETDPIDQINRERALGLVKIAEDLCDEYFYREGMVWAEDALRLDPGLPEAHLISGYLHFKLLDTEEATAAFEKTIQLDPTNYDAHLYLGIIYNGNEQPALALTYLTQAIQLADCPYDISNAFAHRGLSYALMQRYEECFADFDDALQLDPDNGWAILFRGIVLEEMKKRECETSGSEGIPGENIGLTK